MSQSPWLKLISDGHTAMLVRQRPTLLNDGSASAEKLAGLGAKVAVTLTDAYLPGASEVDKVVGWAMGGHRGASEQLAVRTVGSLAGEMAHEKP